MKRWISMLIAIMLMLTMTAFADDNEYLGEMRVVNCKEWVSLREYSDSSSTRLIKVPLGATVENCWRENYEFIYAEYNG